MKSLDAIILLLLVASLGLSISNRKKILKTRSPSYQEMDQAIKNAMAGLPPTPPPSASASTLR